MNRLIGALLVASLTMASTGCFKGEEDTCEFWTEKLAKSSAVDRALKKVGELRCSSAIPVLQQLYEEGQFQESILQKIKEIGDKQASVPILKMALRSETYAKLAASIIADWRLTETKGELVKILTDDKLAESRDAALTAILAFEDPKALEDTLIALAGYDPNIQGFEVNAKAIDVLGEIASVKAVPTIVKMAYSRTNKAAEVYRNARIALTRIGTGVREKVEGVLAGDDQDIKNYTRGIGVQDWESRYGPKTVQMLGDTMDPKAVPALAKSLSDELVPPAGVSDKALEAWINGQKTRLKVIMLALSRLGTDQAVETLGKVVKDPAADTRGQRLNAAFALAAIGSEPALTALVEAWKNEPTEEFKRPLLQQLSLAVDNATLTAIDKDLNVHVDALKEALGKSEVKVEEIKGKIAAGPDESQLETLRQEEAYYTAERDGFKLTIDQVGVYLNATRECQDNESCWLKKIQSKDQNEQVKALNILARGKIGDRQRVVDAMFAAFNSAEKAQLDTKNFALIGIARLGNAVAAARLLKIVSELSESDVYWRDELTALGNALSRRK
jgi:HEAT repeat protein